MNIQLSASQQFQIVTALGQQFDELTECIPIVLRGVEKDHCNGLYTPGLGHDYDTAKVEECWQAIKGAWVRHYVDLHLKNLQERLNLELDKIGELVNEPV